MKLVNELIKNDGDYRVDVNGGKEEREKKKREEKNVLTNGVMVTDIECINFISYRVC